MDKADEGVICIMLRRNIADLVSLEGFGWGSTSFCMSPIMTPLMNFESGFAVHRFVSFKPFSKNAPGRWESSYVRLIMNLIYDRGAK